MTLSAIVDLVLIVVVVVEFLLILALARELGRIQVRLGPLGARTTSSGPRIGASAPVIAGLRDHLDRRVTLGGPSDRDTLVVFVSPTCVACHALIPGLRTTARGERDLDVVLIADGEAGDHDRFLADHRPGDRLHYVISMEAGMRYEAGLTPYAVLLDRTGVVRAKGLCNHLQQVESLLNARDTGFATLQDLPATVEPTGSVHQPTNGAGDPSGRASTTGA